MNVSSFTYHFVLLLPLSCTAVSPKFSTTLSLPVEQELSEPRAEQATPLVPHRGDESTDRLVRNFFFSLASESHERLIGVLADGATVTRGARGSAQPAISELPSLLLNHGQMQGAEEAASKSMGPIHIQEYTYPDEGTVWVSVFVSSPTEVRGRWRLRVNTTSSVKLIEEIVLPDN